MKNFKIQIILRVVALAAALTACVFLWVETTFYLSAALLSMLAIYQVVRLIHYVELTNRKLSRFLDSIRYSDFSRSFTSQKQGRSFKELDESFTQVVDAFKKQRLETQVQFRYMQTVVRHIGIGLIAFNQKGEVELLNTAAKRLFDTSGLYTMEDLKHISPALLKAIKKVGGRQQEIVQVSINHKSLQLAIRSTVFRLRDEQYKLISLQDINAALQEKEMEAWQKLTQVLAHEIMNSVTPIASLSDTVQMLLRANAQEIDEGYLIKKEAVNDVSEALETIEKRSEGLIRFVNSYRDFTKIPRLQTTLFSVKELLARVQNLNKGEASEHHITIQVSVVPQSLELRADPHLIEQVLINLIKNAFRALREQPKGTIKLQAELSRRGGIRMLIADDGPGIPAENLDKIFIPFYSTQRPYKRGGSGIGLSLSRKILRAHGGSLSVKSTLGEGTTFTLQF